MSENSLVNIRKNFIWNILGTLTYSFTSLIFMIVATRINGVEEAGAFTIAFTTSCLLQVIGNYAGRTFQVTEPKESIVTHYDFINHKVITSLIMIICSFFFAIFRGYESFKFILLIMLSILKLIESYCESYYAIMQQSDELYKSGISMFLKGIGSIFIFFIVDLITKNLIASVVVIIVWAIIITVCYDYRIIKSYQIQKKKYEFKNILYIFKHGFFVFIITFLTQYVVNSQKYAIDAQLSDSFQTIFGIIIMPATFVILSGQFLVQPFIVSLSTNFERKNYIQFTKSIFKIILSIGLVGVLIVCVASVLGIPVLEFIYGIDLDEQRVNLLIILTGATLYAISFMFSTALIIMRKTKSQAILFTLVSVFTFVFSTIMVSSFELCGASFAYLITMLILTILYLIDFLFYIWRYVEEEKRNV